MTHKQVIVKPLEEGSPIIDTICLHCGGMYSMKRGHRCSEELDA